MCRVLLVDDEKMARVGLRSTFDWEENGYTLVGEASNGQNAMKWIENKEVDILITDIAMPVMDGLELTRKTREMCPWVKVLLLSCHSDFEYVREGIRLGASDYILKPTLDSDSLRSVLQQMRQKLQEEKQNQHIIEQFKDQQHSNTLKELEKTFCKALCGDAKAMMRMQQAWTEGNYRIAVVRPDVTGESSSEQEALFIEQSETLKQYIHEMFPSSISVQIRPDFMVAILPADKLKDAIVQKNIEYLRDQASFDRFQYSVGMSRIHNALSQIQSAYREAKKSLAYGFFNGPCRVLLAESQLLPEAEPPYDYMTALNELQESLTMGFHAKSKSYIDQIINCWVPQYRTKDDVLQEAEDLLSLFALCKDTDRAAVRQIRQLGHLRYVSEVAEHVKQCFIALCGGDEKPKPDKTLHQRIVMQAIKYIDAHYTESLSLQQVADEVCVSRNYFSEMFKRVTGQNFIDYLLALRVKKAKELLQSSSFKVYEVAERSGFNDVKYFSKQFKKMVGMSPAEFQGLREDK
ncbi:response regulator [Paenibacillus abyssi]|uniref:AraC family transcriptional regulator n=1 Tax=Paenibacillus abyssi TaxID=1340531 RepID=A0A917G6N8_9BACL|nr:response regulator [Paenibacillus abyssi]GGG25684.1 AraC family transcriptional regulator [Paenibacillus abyssi]